MLATRFDNDKSIKKGLIDDYYEDINSIGLLTAVNLELTNKGLNQLTLAIPASIGVTEATKEVFGFPQIFYGLNEKLVMYPDGIRALVEGAVLGITINPWISPVELTDTEESFFPGKLVFNLNSNSQYLGLI